MVAAKPDCTGQRFGDLTVLGKGEVVKDRGKSRRLWRLRCDCGNEIKLPKGAFDRNTKAAKSCGCRLKKNGSNPKDIAGQRFGSLTAIRLIPEKKIKDSLVWECLCDCGNRCEISTKKIGDGYRLNCGDRLKHGFNLHYPPTPTPYPKESGAIVNKYLFLTEPLDSKKIDAAVQDRRIDQLIRAAWIITYRKQNGEVFSEKHERNFIKKHLKFCEAQIYWQRKLEEHGGLAYNVDNHKKEIGNVMTDLTSQSEVVNETQPDFLHVKNKKRLKFQRC